MTRALIPLSAVEFISCDWSTKTQSWESILDSISAIEVPASMCILTTFYHTYHYHYNYVATGDVVKFNYYHNNFHYCIIIIESLTKYKIYNFYLEQNAFSSSLHNIKYENKLN